MHVVIPVESTTIVSPITTFELELIPMFFPWIPLKNLKALFKVEALLLLLLLLLV
jgi:hypothetical protein